MRKQRTDRRLAAIALATGFTLAAPDAFAFHEGTERIVGGTAYTLQTHEWKLGLFRSEVGVFDWLDVGIYNGPWLALAPNVQLKFQVYQGERFALALSPGFLFVGLGLYLPDDADAKLYIVPLELLATYDVTERFSVTLEGTVTGIWGTGTYDADDVEGAAALSNGQVGLGMEWRVNRIWALTLQGRYMFYHDNEALGSTTVTVDSDTTAEFHGNYSANLADLDHAFSVSLSATASWNVFNFKFGAGYGNYTISGLNVVFPTRLPYPELDLFWRF